MRSIRVGNETSTLQNCQTSVDLCYTSLDSFVIQVNLSELLIRGVFEHIVHESGTSFETSLGNSRSSNFSVKSGHSLDSVLDLLDRSFLRLLLSSSSFRDLTSEALSLVTFKLSEHLLLLLQELGLFSLLLCNGVLPFTLFVDLLSLGKFLVSLATSSFVLSVVLLLFDSSLLSNSLLELLSFCDLLLLGQVRGWLSRSLSLANDHKCFFKVRIITVLVNPLHRLGHTASLTQKQCLLSHILRVAHFLQCLHLRGFDQMRN